MVDVILAIDLLVPGADYDGAFEENSYENFTGMEWNDDRDKPSWDEILVKNDEAQLAMAKDDRKVIIRDLFLLNSLKPVTVVDENDETTYWNGGFDSAIRLDAALRLTQKIPSNTTCVIHDVYNNAHEYSFSGIDIITVRIGANFQTKFAHKEALMVQIEDAATVSGVEAVTW